jgi:hypothetical protein
MTKSPNRSLAAFGACMAFAFLTGCATQTSVGVRSEPSRAMVYLNEDAPEFRPARGIGVDNHLQTPSVLLLNWKEIKAKNARVKVIWLDGSESQAAVIQRNSPDLRILFTKDGAPTVEEFKK